MTYEKKTSLLLINDHYRSFSLIEMPTVKSTDLTSSRLVTRGRQNAPSK